LASCLDFLFRRSVLGEDLWNALECAERFRRCPTRRQQATANNQSFR
jgi:hypothetical protein